MKQRKNINFIWGVCLSILFGLSSCISPKMQPNQALSVPANFGALTDTQSMAHWKYRYFFKDSLLCQLIDSAIERNLDVKMASQRIEMVFNEHRFAKGLLLPSVNASTFMNPRKYGYYTMDDAGNRVTEFFPGKLIPTHLPDYFVGLQTSWELDLWGKLKGKKRAAWSRYLSGVEGKNLWITQVVDRVASLYYELVALDVELEMVRSAVSIQSNALDIMKVQKEASVVNELSVKQFQSLVYHTQSLEVEILQKIALIENEINSWLNRFPQKIERNSERFKNDTLINEVFVGLPSGLMQRRPDIRAAEYELEASNADVKAARAAFYPSLNITGTLGFQAFSTEYLLNFPQSIAYNFLGGLTGPLLNRSAIKSQFGKANAAQMESLYRYQKSVVTAYLEVASELSNVRFLREMENLKGLQVGSLDRGVEIAKELFLTGRASYLEVLTAQRSALEANKELIGIKKSKFLANVHLYKALGGGW